MPINRLMRSALVLAVAATSACLDSTAPQGKSIEETEFAASLGVDLAASTKTANGAYYRDIVPGSGPAITTGKISVRYTGYLSNGVQFESNISNANPLQFTFGQEEVIKGFEETLIGVKVGAKRQLIIPYDLAYGSFNYGPIPGNSNLVFVVEVVSAP
jgi:FKBP-type peptidyl-prolyl cis-trans isomerase FkpA